MTRTTIVALLFLVTAGCAQGQQATAGVEAAEIALTDAERLALIYTSQAPCGAAGAAPAPLCSDPATKARIKQLDQSAYQAVKAAEANSSLLDAALDAIKLLRSAIPSK